MIPEESEIGELCASDAQLASQMAENSLTADQVARELFRKEWLRATLDLASRDVLPPTPEDVRRYYDNHPQRWLRQESRRVRHILITIQSGYAENTEEAALARISDIRQKLLAGQSFVEFALKYSECPTALQEGELGWMTRDQLFDEIADEAFSLEVGVLSEPIKSRLGYHLLQVMELKPERYEPFEVVEEKLAAALLKRRKIQKQQVWVRQLAEERRHAS
jgi:peptidyl-prolyl cis-trans isomerase C